MTRLRVGTRGSDLALNQSRSVCALLHEEHPFLAFEEVVIRTHGDEARQQPFDIHWPAGGFTGAIEQALLRGEIDLAVHSYKDLPTAATPGLVVAAVPPRGPVHDVLVSDGQIDLSGLSPGFRIGTSSPRRAAQLRWYCGPVAVYPLRGNVPTRLAKLEDGELDAVVLAAAGLQRLGIEPENAVDLPVGRFVPAPAQGALAVQVRQGDPAADLVAVIDDEPTRTAVEAERSFLRAIGAGCHTAASALGTVLDGSLSLHGQWFSQDGSRMVEAAMTGHDGKALGEMLAKLLRNQMGAG